MATNGYRITASTGLHKGDRAYQQDQVALLTHPRYNGCVLAVVADGMGGRSGGRKAADQVMLTARQLFDRYDPATEDAAAVLLQIIEEAHLVIRLTAISAEQEPHSTLAAFLITPAGDCHWAHSGDSRIYHFRAGTFIQRSTDHSYVQDLVNKGEITQAEAATHPQSHVLMGCLGTANPPPVEQRAIGKLRAGDALVVCSDGVWPYFSTSEIGAMLSTLTAREAAQYLIETARDRADGGGDNLSLAVVRVDALQSSQRAA